MSPEKFHDCLASPPASPLPKPAESAAETTAQSAAEHFVFHSDMSNFGTVRARARGSTALDRIPIEKRRTYEAVPASGRPGQRTYDAMAFAF